jgi:hypothetical protein
MMDLALSRCRIQVFPTSTHLSLALKPSEVILRKIQKIHFPPKMGESKKLMLPPESAPKVLSKE